MASCGPQSDPSRGISRGLTWRNAQDLLPPRQRSRGPPGGRFRRLTRPGIPGTGICASQISTPSPGRALGSGDPLPRLQERAFRLVKARSRDVSAVLFFGESIWSPLPLPLAHHLPHVHRQLRSCHSRRRIVLPVTNWTVVTKPLNQEAKAAAAAG